MNISDIVSLTKAGFTKEDIMQILNTEQPQQAFEQPQQAVEQPQQAVEQPQQAVEQYRPQSGTAVDTRPQSGTAVDTRLDYIINRLNLMAVNNSNTGVPQTESTDDILASIINPTYNKKGE